MTDASKISTANPAGQAAMKAAMWMTGAIVSFSSMAVAGRAVRLELDTFELMMYRSFIGIFIVLTIGTLTGTLKQVRGDRLHIHFARNACHFAGQNLWFFAITLIPLAQVFAIEFTAPLWVTLLAPLILQERLTSIRAIAAVMGFVGILVVARPDPSNLDLGTVAAAVAAIGFAGTALFTKLLTRHETITSILFWLTIMQAVFGVVCALLMDGQITWPSSASWPWLILIGCAGLTAHFCLTRALSIAPAIIVMPMDFVRLPVIAVVGMLLYGEPLEVAVFAGAALVFGGNLLNLWAETRRSRNTA